jgi:O-antigen/teichoic acid export membrane protein
VTDLGRAAARGAGIAVGAQGARFILQIASLVVLSRLLTPTDFGLVAMVTAVLGIAEILRDFGLSSAAVQAKTLSDAQRSNLFWVNLGIGMSCTLIVIACIPLIAKLYDQPALGPIILSLAWLFIISGANTQFRAELSRSLRFKALAVADVTAQAVSVTASIVAATIGFGYWAIVIQQVVLVLVTCTTNIFQCRWRPGLPRRGVPMRSFFKYGGALLGMQTLGYTTNNVDNIAIGAYWGPMDLGLYSRGYQLLLVPLNQIANALTQVVLPIMSRVQDDVVAFGRYVHRAQLACSYLFGSGFAIAAGLASPIVLILLGKQWSEVAPIFAILAIGGMFRGFSQVTYWIGLSKGLTGAQFRIYLVVRPLMIALILAGLPWGPRGVAVGHSLAFLLDWVVSIWWVGSRAGMNVRQLMLTPIRSVLVVSAPAGLLAFAGSRLVSSPFAELSIGLVLSAAYIAMIMTFSATEREHGRLTLDMGRMAFGRRSRPA